MMQRYSNKQFAGFTLVEMAIVLVILGFVLSALLLPLQAQRELVFQAQTQTTLENARRALLGFAQQQGRLPCPATAASNGRELPLGGGTCNQQVGFLPAATLGITPVDANGFAIDSWNNRIRYAVTQNSSVLIANAATPDFTSNIADNPLTPLINEADGMNVVGIANLTPNLRVCNSSTGITAVTCSVIPPTEVNYASNNAVAVIYSIGETGALGSVGQADETENLNATVANVDTVFVSHGIVGAGAVGGEFDHLVVWISPFVLYNAMIEAGQLH